MNSRRKMACSLTCAILVCLLAQSARGAGDIAWSKNEARDFLVREKALPKGGELAATWLQATGGRNGFAQAMVIAPPGNGPVTVRYVKDGRLLDDAEAVRLGLSSAMGVGSKEPQAAMKRGTAITSAPRRPVSRLTGEERSRIPRVTLAAPDMKRVADEDAAEVVGEKTTRIGVFRDLPQPLDAVPGQKNALANGTVWTTAITSPGALGQRIAFDELTLPPGTDIILYDAANPDSALGPLDTTTIREWPYWAPTCPGETVVIECRFPKNAPRLPFALRVAKVAHIYRDPLKQALEKALPGDCNQDVTCRPEWADFALAVGGLGSIGLTGALWCTCTLLADVDPCLNLPYVLTANHCVRGQTGSRGAESLEFYWRYQTPTCNGTAPSLLDVPRTVGGADYLAGMIGNSISGGGNDFTFLRLRNEPPSDLTRMGWSATPPPIGTKVLCIHYPEGSFKRISDGTITKISSPYPQWFHQVTWDLGTTEAGSSGAPLAVAATGQIIGQLWGGGASCSTPTDPDYFGRFDFSYTTIRAFLESPAAFMDHSAVSIDKNADSVSIGLSLSRPADGPIDVLVTPEPGTALPGLDYVDTAQTVHFDKAQSSQTCVFPTLPNPDPTGNHSFTLLLSCPSGCALPAEGQSATEVTLVDNTPPKVSSLTVPWYEPR